ncbi:MAG: hypothetical protein CMB80_15035 [Flammeovirgaceae bacterium]|nr:hypothetical protein [Flammeovirgaceae bacterium]
MLKYQLESLDGLDDVVKAEYKEEDGPDGKKVFFLDVEGAVPKARHDEFRTNNIALTNEVTELKARFKDVDPDKYAALLTLEAEVAEGKHKGRDIEDIIKERVATVTEEHETQVRALTDANGVQAKQLEVLLVDQAVTAASVENGVLPTAVSDVVLRAKSVFKVEEGVAVPYKGEDKIYGRDGVTAISVGDWVKELKKNAGHLFTDNSGGGSKGGGSGNVDVSKMSPTEKINAGLQERG